MLDPSSDTQKSVKHSSEKGASAIEYALLIACLVLVLVTALSTFGTNISESIKGLIDKIQTQITGNK